MYFRHFYSQLHVLSFSECLNAVPGVLVAGSERRDNKNKEIYMTVNGDLCSLTVMLLAVRLVIVD